MITLANFQICCSVSFTMAPTTSLPTLKCFAHHLLIFVSAQSGADGQSSVYLANWMPCLNLTNHMAPPMSHCGCLGLHQWARCTIPVSFAC